MLIRFDTRYVIESTDIKAIEVQEKTKDIVFSLPDMKLTIDFGDPAYPAAMKYFMAAKELKP